MSTLIYVVSKEPVSKSYIPELNSAAPLINKREVIKRTNKGYRLKLSYCKEKGVMYLDEHYSFFESYGSALEYIAAESNRIAGELEEMKLKAMRLMSEAHDELRSVQHDN
ncbi:hypothetical protein ABW11_00900 [Pluralibacter gergoviae]|uniref:hypothetical protein n=1 Tax=Pluralibacter gergoviae TaxID=61647 RepID=UPI0006512201|nr:hypothetical protein [Pluralibacter gergoviae]KMK30141.1 hypothetical protein ABW11_00900 [Pluralibacter gergoviae]KMK43634.1 hypothetical protein ABW13_02330 [Pluralibacter gergoviae]SUB72182.1 Uncharacterised protein [Pluralibacter gergoviae]